MSRHDDPIARDPMRTVLLDPGSVSAGQRCDPPQVHLLDEALREREALRARVRELEAELAHARAAAELALQENGRLSAIVAELKEASEGFARDVDAAEQERDAGRPVLDAVELFIAARRAVLDKPNDKTVAALLQAGELMEQSYGKYLAQKGDA